MDQYSLARADLTGAKLEKALLSGVILDGAKLIQVKGRGVSLAKELAGANLDDADLRDASVDFIKLTNGSARRTDFTGAEISAANFAGSDLTDAIFRRSRCQWYPPQFKNANLTDADFMGASLLPGADFSGANLTRAKLRNVSLVRADFRGANLRDVDLTDADIDGALFDGVDGISAEEVAALQAKAARWKYDLQVRASAALEIVHIAAFFLAPLLATWMGFRLRRRSGQAVEPAPEGAFMAKPKLDVSPSQSAQKLHRYLGNTILCLNGSALFVLAYLIVFLSCGSPVAQFNAADDARMSAWSQWVHVYPYLVLLVVLCFIASAGILLFCCVGIFVNARFFWRPLLGSILTVAHIALEFQFLGKFFPTA